MPLKISGLAPNWTAAVWTKGQTWPLAPVAVRPDTGEALATISTEKEAGEIYIGNLLVCDNPAVLLRLLQPSDGGFDVLAHNPTDQPLTINVAGCGPVAGWKQSLKLEPGAEVRVSATVPTP